MANNQLTDSDRKEFIKLVSNDLEAGELEKVTGLFQYNQNLFELVGELVKDDRMKVRLGINMLVDELREVKPEYARLAIPGLLELLDNESPTIRGDAADLLGMVGDMDTIVALERLLKDDSHQVVEIATDAINDIMGRDESNSDRQ